MLSSTKRLLPTIANISLNPSRRIFSKSIHDHGGYTNDPELIKQRAREFTNNMFKGELKSNKTQNLKIYFSSNNKKEFKVLLPFETKDKIKYTAFSVRMDDFEELNFEDVIQAFAKEFSGEIKEIIEQIKKL